jgi:hypothetical protein
MFFTANLSLVFGIVGCGASTVNASFVVPAAICLWDLRAMERFARSLKQLQADSMIANRDLTKQT